MAFVVADRVKETCSAPGTGTVTLLGATTGYVSFSVIGNGNSTYYCIATQGGNDWEVGVGTYTSAGTTLSRDTVLSNSAGTTAKINFSTGTQDVFVTYPSTRSIYTNSAGTAITPATASTLGVTSGGTGLSSGTSGGVPYFSSNTAIQSSAALAANAIVIGGGAGAAPATTTTGTGVVTAIGNAVNTSGGLVTQSGTLAASALLLGGGSGTAISSTTTGTGVVTALGVNVGTAGAFVVNGGALGTPSSGTVTNLTGTASININGTVGATTPAAGTFTSLSDSGNLTFTGTGNRITGDFSSSTLANRVAFQTSTANTSTIVGFLPNGTGTTSALQPHNSSDITNSSFMNIFIDATTANIASNIRGTGTYLPMLFSTGGSERMRIDTSGNVGIGSSTYSTSATYDQIAAVRPLQVIGSSSSTTIAGSTAALTIANSDTTTSNTAQLNFAAVTGASANLYSSATISAVFGARTNSQYPTGQLVFSTSTTLNSAPTEKMRIDSSGNVGIGTSSPQTKLHVVTTSDGAQTIFSGAQSTTEQTLLFRNAYYTNNTTAGVAAIGWIDSGASGGNLTFKTGVNGGGPTNIPTEKMRIDNAGNVGIGTNAPGSTLDVKGTLRLSGSSSGYVGLKGAAAAGSTTYTLPSADGTSGQFLKTDGSATLSWATAGSSSPTTNTYNTGTAATWTKPASANWVLIEMWGGGGSGGRGANNTYGGSGGGGGAYSYYLVKFADLQGAVTYTVAAGGAAQGTANTAGNVGGNTTVTLATFAGGGNITLTAYGGGGGGNGNTNAGGGGGGGGWNSAGSKQTTNTIVGGPAGTNGFAGNGGNTYDPCTAPTAGGVGFWGGGGGGGATSTAGSNGAAGGASIYGGGGGGGTTRSGGAGVGGSGGSSTFGGAGGGGNKGTTVGVDGTQPAGGGGASENANSGKGGDGRVQFTYW